MFNPNPEKHSAPNSDETIRSALRCYKGDKRKFCEKYRISFKKYDNTIKSIENENDKNDANDILTQQNLRFKSWASDNPLIKADVELFTRRGSKVHVYSTSNQQFAGEMYYMENDTNVPLQEKQAFLFYSTNVKSYVDFFITKDHNGETRKERLIRCIENMNKKAGKELYSYKFFDQYQVETFDESKNPIAA